MYICGKKVQAICLDVLQGTYRVEVGNEVVQVEQ